MVGKNTGQNKLDLNKIETEKTKKKPVRELTLRERNQSNEKCGFWIVAQQANY